MSGYKSLNQIKNRIPPKATDTSVSTNNQIKGLRKVTLKTKNLIHFPENLFDDNFDNKRMYITIYESKSVDNIEKQILNTAKKLKDEPYNAAINAKGDVWDKGSAAIKTVNSILNESMDFKGEEKIIIALPLPNELQDSQSHGYSTETGVIKDISDKVDSLNPLFSIQKAIGQVASTLSVQRILANPGYYQNYTGSDPRSFTFSFKLIPNSQKEADTIIRTISTIKKYSSPTLSAGSILLAPNFFHFWFSNETLQVLTGIRPCIISDVQTNYAGSGILETTMDGMPKYIDLSITIKELRAITSDKWAV